MIITIAITKRELQDNHYVVTEMGAVWSYRQAVGKPLKPSVSTGYKQVRLSIKRKGHKWAVLPLRVHRLVCLWFHGEPPTPEHVVNHKDGNKLNNHKDNLEWTTQRDNVIHFYENKC